MRGRKKQENSFTEILSIRITEEQKLILVNNKWIAAELREYVREYLDAFSNAKS